MTVLQRDYFSLIAIRAPLETLVSAFHADGPVSVSVERAVLAFPTQPYSATDSDLPMILWSPVCSPELTAFMPAVQSGDYFVAQYSHDRFGLHVVETRSTTQCVEWPVNEFIAHTPGGKRRIVRSMRDSPRWSFYAEGEPLGYEKLDNYTKRRIRDRVTRSDVLQLIAAWGAPVQTPDFWRTSKPAYTFRRT